MRSGRGAALFVAGNMTAWNGNGYEYDALGMMTRMTAGAEDWRYLYTADDERFWAYGAAGSGGSLWYLRDLDGKVLRQYDAHISWATVRDYVYRDGQPLASSYPGEGVRHFSLDHLGTPRAITDSAGVAKVHVYFPYGEEFSSTTLDVERMKFTGHERDFANPGSVADDLDYMHARHYNPLPGRFLSADPRMSRAALRSPQRWNGYGYGVNNPVKMVDPDGRTAMVFSVAPSRDDAKGAFGHSAIYVTHGGRSAGISYGGNHAFKNGIRGFIAGYTGEGRRVTMYVLKTSPEQDRKMLSFVQSHPDGGVDRNGTGADLMVRQNCTTAVCNTLKSGDVLKPTDDASGALSGAHAPSELQEALESGSLSGEVSVIHVFDPVEDAKAQQGLSAFQQASCFFVGGCLPPR